MQLTEDEDCGHYYGLTINRLYEPLLQRHGTVSLTRTSVSSPLGPSVNDEFVRRGLLDGTNPYAPQTIDCPSPTPSIRNATSLSEGEISWIQTRRNKTIEPMIEFLNHINITGFDSTEYVNRHRQSPANLPNIGIAVSGGGYRAMLSGAGAVAAFDSTNTAATAGGLGGLLQSATYISGLSGGSWLLGSLYSKPSTSVQTLMSMKSQTMGSVWQLQDSIFQGTSSTHV